MAYQLKYYKDIISKGVSWRLEIQQDTSDTIIAIEIGPVLQSLRLVMQGDQADIDTPIVKTSLEMSFIDAPDLGDTRKNGYWEEFYTSSALEYRVQLYKNGTLYWSGFVTPDSFSEDLRYRGSVNIIARDNLGFLQDQLFDLDPDANGMVSFDSILHGLRAKGVDMYLMTVKNQVQKQPYALDSSSQASIFAIQFNHSAFKDKTWWEVLESTLYATGCVMRFRENGYIYIVPLRGIGLGNKTTWQSVPVKEAKFLAYGHRELSPSVKSIHSSIDFDIVENIAEIDMPAEAYGNKSDFTFNRLSLHTGAVTRPTDIIPVHAIVGGNWQPRAASASLAFNTHAYPLKEGHSSRKQGNIHDSELLYVVANGGVNTADDGRSVEYRQLLGPGNYKISFELGNIIALYDDLTKVGFIDADVRLTQIRFTLRFTSNDGTEIREYRTSSSSWATAASSAPNTFNLNTSFPYRLACPELSVTKNGVLSLVFTRIGVSLNEAEPASRGTYVAVREIKITDALLETTPIPGSQKYNTVYKKDNSVLLNRKPEFGINPATIASPSIVRNGMYMFLQTNPSWPDAPEQWVFNAGDTPQPLEVLIHQQLLAYYSQPNNVLTGELLDANGQFPDFTSLWQWGGKEHILTSGTLNILTGRMENAVLRGFTRYDRMWETWAETDYFDLDYPAQFVDIVMHSTKVLVKTDIQKMPTWCTFISIADNVVRIRVQQATTSRSATFSIDTAYIRIDQRGAGDYGADYSEDYS